jgi:hypothetical protein
VLRSIAKWLIVVALFAYGSYTAWLAFTSQYWFLLWTVACYGAAVGLALSKRWSQYLVYLVAAFTAGGWLYVVATIAVNRWPYPDVLSSVIALAPGMLLVALCVLCSLFVRRLFVAGTKPN